MMMIKAVVMDMDGTLLNEKDEISPETRDYLIGLEKQGISLILASGRSYTRLLPYAKELKMDKYGGWLIEVDGVALYETKSNTRNKFHEMPPEEIAEIFDWFTTTGAEPQAVFDDGLFDFLPERAMEKKRKIREENNLPDSYPWTAGPWGWLADLSKGYPKISYVKSAAEIERPVNKLQIMDDEEAIQKVFDEACSRFGERFSIYRTTPKQLEVLPLGFSKGAAVERLMKENGWKRDEVAVFGDGENDVSMLEAVDHSFAMGNARDYVQQKARYVTDTNRNNGIVKGLVSLGLPESGNLN